MAALQKLGADDVGAVRAAVDADGACIVEGLLTSAVCERLLADFDPHLKALDWGVDDLGYRNEFYGRRTKRLHGLFSKSPLMAAVLTHPLLVGLAENLFVDSDVARDVRLSNAELMVLTAGQGNQDFHTDAVSWRRAQAREDGEILISANIALTDFTATNGATRVVPGSHRWEAGREPKDEEVCLAEMKRGSALIYSGNAIHSGGASTEEAARVGLYLGYIPSWLKPIENHLVTNAPEDVRALPETAQRLLDVVPGGFAVYA